MVIRIAGVGIAGIALLVAACGGQNGTTAHSGSASAPATSATTAAASNEDQIRDVLTKESQAFSAFDFDKVAEFTCAKYRDQAKDAGGAIPPMSMFPASAASSIGAQAFADQLGAQFGGASRQSLLAVADAVIKQDEPAYKAAMLDVVKQTMSVQLVQVENILVSGNTATADATVTQRVGTKPPDTRTSPANFVLEDGQWKDCTPPAQP
jgi:hypothetical protein